MKRITIKDVAKKLNVSVSTVSRAFNDKYDIKEETKDLILATAKSLGYRPNPIARKLIQQRSYNIGIIVPEFVNSYFPDVIMEAQKVLIDKGYQVLIMQSHDSSETELKNLETLLDNMVDGLIVSLIREDDNIEKYKELVDAKMPIVFFNRVADKLDACKVVFDDFKWAFFATEHLILQGYEDIVYLSGPKHMKLSLNRIMGFEKAHRKHKREVGKIIPCGFYMEDGAAAAKLMIETNNVPRAIFAANDHCAIGAMRVFKEYGYNIPNDVAIVGFTESRLAEHIHPTLTTVEQPTKDIGITAANLLIEQLENKGMFVPQTIVLNGRLNVRESSVTH
ncbi:LacI family DNA-binding transcriptional regulator [Wenyingzhuangia aestuarii]|uniref:LacI family DNA-binding transcriptional regulator n=1 Tax=Wenyingzhuangia aestuarii TaxID=1647582 RepID=UPI001438B325|nr:LacI family DNA-binding transcriptional regulator [Wenyingzhuangia aestuarii]NJB81668.1 DNA-binding LacI/PurR family transcriptional regulator [Wenyingzhuangia aestuarii]